MGHPAWLGQSPHGWGIGKIWENHLEMEDVPAMNGRMKLLVEGFTCSLRTQNARRPNSHFLAGHIAQFPGCLAKFAGLLSPLVHYITGLSPRSRSSEQQPTIVILILEIAHQMPPENTGYPNKLCCVGYSHSGPHLEEFKHAFFPGCKISHGTPKTASKGLFSRPLDKAICFCNFCTPFVVH